MLIFFASDHHQIRTAVWKPSVEVISDTPDFPLLINLMPARMNRLNPCKLSGCI